MPEKLPKIGGGMTNLSSLSGDFWIARKTPGYKEASFFKRTRPGQDHHLPVMLPLSGTDLIPFTTELIKWKFLISQKVKIFLLIKAPNPESRCQALSHSGRAPLSSTITASLHQSVSGRYQKRDPFPIRDH